MESLLNNLLGYVLFRIFIWELLWNIDNVICIIMNICLCSIFYGKVQLEIIIYGYCWYFLLFGNFMKIVELVN